jgi:transposase
MVARGAAMTDLLWLAKAQIEWIAPKFPLPHGITRVDDQRMVSGILHVLSSGPRWRDAPTEYGLHNTLYNRFIHWSRRGVFNRIFAGLAGRKGRPDSLMIDDLK